MAKTTSGASPPAPRCPHCLRRAVCPRHRGLCQRCHGDPAVRALYPLAPPTARTTRGVEPPKGPPVFGEPTGATPGSEDKLLVLIERAKLGQQLFHPGDFVEETPLGHTGGASGARPPAHIHVPFVL